jgi:hypothetical protein
LQTCATGISYLFSGARDVSESDSRLKAVRSLLCISLRPFQDHAASRFRCRFCAGKIFLTRPSMAYYASLFFSNRGYSGFTRGSALGPHTTSRSYLLYPSYFYRGSALGIRPSRRILSACYLPLLSLLGAPPSTPEPPFLPGGFLLLQNPLGLNKKAPLVLPGAPPSGAKPGSK